MSQNKKPIKEGVLDSMDEDGWMAKSQLYQTAKYAIELHKIIQDTDNLEPWVQSKITKCADYLESIKHYMEYEAVNNHPEEVPAEAPVAVEVPAEAPVEASVVEAESCKYCGGNCPNDEEHACDGYLGDIDNLYSSADISKYSVGDESTVNGRWHDISAIEDGTIWITDEDGEESEHYPGSEDNWVPVREDKIGSDTEDLWLEKMASAGLKRANEGSMSDIAAAADEVATMIEAGATDQEIMDHTGLRDAQVKFLRNSLQDRPAQYEAKKAK